jgi:prolyl-tRNA synthetase
LKFRSVVPTPAPSAAAPPEEFHVLADSGEDAIAFSDGDAYAANLRWRWRCRRPRRVARRRSLQEVATPGARPSPK